MDIVTGGEFKGERALFAANGLDIREARFFDGESPLKEGCDLFINSCSFEWKYPIWYCDGVYVRDTYFSPTARSGIWYTKNISMYGCKIDAPKTFRRCENITLSDVTVLNAQETLWNCEGVLIHNSTVRGDYFGMGCCDVHVDGLRISGNYLFDGGRDIVVKNSVLYSKDAFWNCRNVTVIDCVIVGEYLGWNSKNVKFINCDIESNQGLCYMDGVVLENCRLKNTDLAFEYSKVRADIASHVDSVKNPISGRIVADSIGEIIHEDNAVSVKKTKIIERKGK